MDSCHTGLVHNLSTAKSSQLSPRQVCLRFTKTIPARDVMDGTLTYVQSLFPEVFLCVWSWVQMPFGTSDTLHVALLH